MCYALLFAAIVRSQAGDIPGSSEAIEELARVAHEHSFTFYTQCLVPMQTAALALSRGYPEEAETKFGLAIEQWRRAGERVALPGLLGLHARCALLRADCEKASGLVEEGLSQIALPGWEERCFEAGLLQIKGDILWLRGDLAGAQDAHQSSLAVARSQQARLFELRTAISYAAMLNDQHRAKDALAVLEPLYARFPQIPDTKELQDARTLLASLRSG
jgi:ATP/maltotriose-dependent transcriptional regulator MalT